MKRSGPSEGAAVVSEFRSLLEGWEKHCGTLHALADQIMALQRCERGIINVPQETFTDLHNAIQVKIVEELQALSDIITTMEDQLSAMTSIVDDFSSSYQRLLDNKDRRTSDLESRTTQLHTLRSLRLHMAQLIGMRRVPFLQADSLDLITLRQFKKVNATCKTLESEFEGAATLLESNQ